MMKIKRLSLLVCLLLTTFSNLFAQGTSYIGFPPSEPTTTQSDTDGEAGASRQQEETATQTQNVEPEFSGINSYDPYMDNHLHAPPSEKPIGLFGKPIKEVEKILDQYGAKNYSYAFGKYSRMRISPYLLTMYFNRQRRLGGLAVEPMAPFKYIAPSARKFFIGLFLQNQSMEKFKSIISRNRLELRYKPD
ncbi:MAG: hypothetical protein ACQETH_11940 [Candidatus Rifleibacteriota bacterium]